MQDLVFFQADTGKSVLYPCKPTDTVNLLALAEVFDMDVGEISFGGILIPQKDGYSDSLWSEIKGMMCGAGTKERSILVTGCVRSAAENKMKVQRNVGSNVIFWAFGSMNALRDFVTCVGEDLPPNYGKAVDGNDNLIIIESVPEPTRKCFIPKNLRMGSTAMAQQVALRVQKKTAK